MNNTDSSSSEEDEKAWLELLQAIFRGKHDVIQELLDKHPQLATRTDKQGNTPLHYAVAALAGPTIEFLVSMEAIKKNATTANHEGETVTDWLRVLVGSSMGSKSFSSIRTLAPAIAFDQRESVESLVVSSWVSPELHCIDLEGVIQRPLHLAIRYRRWHFVEMMFSNPLIVNILDAKDSIGQTPMMLAQQQSDDPQAMVALKRMQEMKDAAARQANLTPTHHSVPTKPVLPADYKVHLCTLTTKFLKDITEDDLPALRATIPTLCGLAYLACQLALSQPGTIVQQQLRQHLLQQLVGNASDWMLENIRTMALFLKDIQDRDLAGQLIEFSNGLPDRLLDGNKKLYGYSKFNPCLITKGKIYLDATGRTDPWTVLTTLIHETSHIAVRSHDLAYAGGSASIQDSYVSNLAPLVQLAETAESEEISPEETWAFDTLWKLGNGANQSVKMTLGNFYAAQNAESIAFCIVGAVVINRDCGKVDFRDGVLHADKDILEKISSQHMATMDPPITPRDKWWLPSVICDCFTDSTQSAQLVLRSPHTGDPATSLASDPDEIPEHSSIGSASTASSPKLIAATLTDRVASFPDNVAGRESTLTDNQPLAAGQKHCHRCGGLQTGPLTLPPIVRGASATWDQVNIPYRL